MTTTLITGANKSLGLETARRPLEAGHTVYAGMRDVSRGEGTDATVALALLGPDGPTGEFHSRHGRIAY
ncbi:hypothetical protein ITJ57_16460 [Plantibacter sp. VKM Ac-2880]|uniref:hypothetical protein n=1 Tax=Plantibacter sp. VKM Ac-2880 TaxID=2783827 RepID=UPI00188EED83|nr:hypothetical protein [Plantibacter sp. VKM Ac-2880]